MWFVLGYLAGGLTVTLVMWLVIFRRSGKGILRIDHSNPERDIYRFETQGLEQIDNKRYIILQIDHHAMLIDYSQE